MSKIGYHPEDQMFVVLKFYSKDGAVNLQNRFGWFADFETHTVHLENAERVIGYKSRLNAYYSDFVFHCFFFLSDYRASNFI